MAEQQQAEFESMLIALTGLDNAARKQAEEMYGQSVQNDPVWTVQALVQVGCNSANTAAQNVAFVMLRKLLVRKNDAYDRCDAATQDHIKQSLLNFFGSTTEKLLRRAVASCISNLAIKLSSDGKNAWSELWDLLMGAMQSNEQAPELRANCCLIFGQTAPFLGISYLRPHLGNILTALAGCVNVGHGALATEAAEAIVEVVKTADKKDLPAIASSTVIPTLLSAAGNYIGAEDTDTAEALLGALCALSEERAPVVKPHVASVFPAMMTIAQNPQLDKDLRHTAIDVILTYGESDTETFRKDKNFATSLFELMVQYTSRPEMEDDWATTYSNSDEANGSDFEAGASAMDRMSVILRGKQVQELATQHIMANINSEHWESRAAALTILTYVAEGCHKQFLKHLDMIVDQLVLPKLTDSHPMVRYCALQCIAQLSSDFKPIFQETYAAKLLPSVCQVFKDEVPRLRGMAGGTLEQFFEEIEADDEDEFDEDEWENRVSDYKAMQPYMNGVGNALISALTNATYPFERLTILQCLSTATNVAGKLFTPFVHQLVPLYQQVLAISEQTETTEELQKVRKMKCIAIEATTLLATNVKRDGFNDYAHDVCNYLLSVLREGLDSDDVRLRYVLRGWTCMVECLGDQVLPYLDQVLPQLLQVANMDCDIEVTDAEVGDEDENDDRVMIARTQDKDGTKTIKFHTSLIEDKDLAITIIMCIVTELKGLMVPYMNPVTETAVKLLGFLAYPAIRETAADTIAALAKTVKEGAPEQAAAFVAHVVPPLLTALDDEPEISAARQMIETIGTVLENGPHGSLHGEVVATLAKALKEVFDESLERLEAFLSARAKKGDANSSDEDAEELENLAKSEDFLLQDTAETVGKVVKTTPEFIPLFQQHFLPDVARLLDQSKPATYHRLGICILCDFVENAPEAAVAHLSNIANAMVTFGQSNNAEVMQACMFGGGITAELIARAVPQPNADSEQFANTMCSIAVRFLLTPDSRSEEGLSVSANAVSCILRIIESFPNAVDVQASMRTVITHLPVQDDKEEEIRINDRLVRWASDPANPIMSDTNFRQQILYAVKRSKYVSDEARAALQNL